MKVKKLLELQALIEDRKIPVDMTANGGDWAFNDDKFKYWSRI